MKRKIKIIVFIIISFTCIICLDNTKSIVKASEPKKYEEGIEEIGLYAVTEHVDEKMKVYINPDLLFFISTTGREVIKESRLFGDRYYYYADKYVDKIVEVRRIANDIDSVVFMIRELEKIADQNTSIFSASTQNLTLSYIRTINVDYDNYKNDTFFKKWEMVAGTQYESFIKKVNKDVSHGLKFNEFFSQFLIYETQYNKKLHGELNDKFKKNKNNVLYLQDPFDSSKHIDLIHMFASIDGIYENTGTSKLVNKSLTNDIVSWIGDLHTACFLLGRVERAQGYEINFDNWSLDNILYDFKYEYYSDGKMRTIEEYGSSECDILADIDAMNLTKSFLNYDNYLSDSIVAYYQIEEEEKRNRFAMFLKTVTLEKNHDKLYDHNLFNNFQYETYYYFNIYIDDDGNFIDKNYFIDTDYYATLMTGGYAVPSMNVRKFIAKSFIKYVASKVDIMVC